MRVCTLAMQKSNVKSCLPIVMVLVSVPKQSISVPLAAFNLVSLGPRKRCWGVGGRIERRAPPSTNHFSSRFVFVTCKRKQSSSFRPATLFTDVNGRPFRFPTCVEWRGCRDLHTASPCHPMCCDRNTWKRPSSLALALERRCDSSCLRSRRCLESGNAGCC